MILMKLRLVFLIVDLVFRFYVLIISVSSIFIIWIKFMLKELLVLIVWLS